MRGPLASSKVRPAIAGNFVLEKYGGSQVAESMLQEASQLFSDHYGTWGEHVAQVVGEFAKAGKLALDGFVCLLRDTT